MSKIYRVAEKETGRVVGLWSNYRSAVTSRGQLKGAQGALIIEAAVVSDELWRPVNGNDENRALRLHGLLRQLDAADLDEVQRILREMMQRVEQARQEGGAEAPWQLGVDERRELDAAMGRQVDAE